MRLEVNSAADFLMNLLRVKQTKTSLPENQLQHFKGSLQSILVLRFRSHWYPEVPHKGSGYRCIRINGIMDPVVEEAGVAVGLQPRILRKMLPTELTLWIDPEEVSYRIGENGSICVLYNSTQSNNSERVSPSSDLDSTGSSVTTSTSSGGGGGGGEEFNLERIGKMDLTDLQLMNFLEKNHCQTNMADGGHNQFYHQQQQHQQQQQNHQHDQQQKQHHQHRSPSKSHLYQKINNSFSSDDGGVVYQHNNYRNHHHNFNNNNSPPMSPVGFNSSNYRNKYYNGGNNYNNNNNSHQWDGFSSSKMNHQLGNNTYNNNNNGSNTKVRTQC